LEIKPVNIAADTKINHAFVEISKAYAGTMADPYPLYKELLQRSPVYDGDLVADFGVPSLAAGRDGKRRVFCLLGYDVVSKALIDTETFSTEVWREAFDGALGDPILLYMKGDEHRLNRNMLLSILSPVALKNMVDKHFKPTIEGMVKGFARQGRTELMSEFIMDFPVHVVYELFGLPSKNKEAIERFSTRALVMVLGALIDPRKPQEAHERITNALQANREVYDQIIEIVRERRASGDYSGYDMISQLLRNESQGKKMSDHEITQFLLPNLGAAGETTSRGFANLLTLLLERPQLLEQVRNDRSLVKVAINETMRFEGSVSVLPRIVTRDVTVAGVTVPAGSGINVLVGAANRDPAAHDNPDEFRLIQRPRQALSFGFGPHMCMGMPLAKLEMELAFNAVLDYLPNIRFDPDVPYEGIKGIQFRSPTSLNVVWDRH
jgi:cytochrome P450